MQYFLGPAFSDSELSDFFGRSRNRCRGQNFHVMTCTSLSDHTCIFLPLDSDSDSDFAN